MAPIYRNGKEGVLISTNLPFKLLLKLNKNINKAQITFKQPKGKIELKDANKLNNFLLEIKKKKIITFKDSKTNKPLMSGKIDFDVEIDEEWINLLNDLELIDNIFNCNFECPDKLTIEEIKIIDDLKFVIKNHFMQGKFNQLITKFTPENLKKLINELEKKGYIEGSILTHKDFHMFLLGKKISLGESKTKLPPVTFEGDIKDIKQKLTKEKEISVKVIPYKDKNFKTEFEIFDNK